MSNNTGIFEKYSQIKSIALNTGFIHEVKLVNTIDEIMLLVRNLQTRSMLVVPMSIGMYSNDDNVRFTVVIADKVNTRDDELILRSYDNCASALRLISDQLNYGQEENTDLEEVDMGVYDEENADWIATTLTTVFDLSFQVVPNIFA